MILQTPTRKKKRRFAQWLGPLRYLLPVARVHHSQWSYGYVLFPWFPKSLGLFNFGGGVKGYLKHFGYSEPVYRKGFKVVEMDECHNCTWTGVY